MATRVAVAEWVLHDDPFSPQVSFPLIEERSVAQFTVAEVVFTSVKYGYRFNADPGVAEASIDGRSADMSKTTRRIAPSRNRRVTTNCI
jgi:hypothetical protein